jgi:hypothetical protein
MMQPVHVNAPGPASAAAICLTECQFVGRWKTLLIVTPVDGVLCRYPA